MPEGFSHWLGGEPLTEKGNWKLEEGQTGGWGQNHTAQCLGFPGFSNGVQLTGLQQ